MKTLILIALLCSSTAFGQVMQEAHYRDGDQTLAYVLGEALNTGFKKIDTHKFCITSITFVEFVINEKGNVDVIKFYEDAGTPPAFRQLLTAVINATNGKWVPKTINGKPVKSKPFILPLSYQMWAGCDIEAKNLKDLTYSATMSFLKYQRDSTVNDSSDKVYRRDCVLLNPLSIFSNRH